MSTHCVQSGHILQYMYINRFEDIRADRIKELQEIVDFLQFPYKKSEIMTQLKDDFTTFKR